MTMTQLEGYIAAIVKLRNPKKRSLFQRGHGRTRTDTEVESTTTRSISLRRARPAKDTQPG